MTNTISFTGTRVELISAENVTPQQILILLLALFFQDCNLATVEMLIVPIWTNLFCLFEYGSKLFQIALGSFSLTLKIAADL